MMSLFRSSLLLCSLLRQLADLSSIHDAVVYSKTLCSLHITHIIIITICVYCMTEMCTDTFNLQQYCLVSYWASGAAAGSMLLGSSSIAIILVKYACED